MGSMESRERAVRDAVIDIERFAAGSGWDGPVRVFALIRAADALARTPELAGELPEDVVAQARENADVIFSVEQEGLPQADTLEALLAQLAWPDEVDGAAIVAERIVVPPAAEAELPADPAAAIEALASHPQREDVRMVVGVMRDGESWCAMRTRSNDDPASIIESPDAVPGLVAALRATFA